MADWLGAASIARADRRRITGGTNESRLVGMDVFGRNPTAKVGEYFRNTVWRWHPLAELCCAMAPEASAGCAMWHSNDGDGLDADDATTLCAILEARLRNGDVAAYVSAREAALAALPDVACAACEGGALSLEHPCAVCGGRRFVRPIATWYDCSAANVQAFAAFLTHCGGFEIW